MKKLVIADPSFEDWVGHHAPYDLSIVEAAKSRWVPIVWAAKNVNTDALRDSGYIRCIYTTSAWGKSTFKKNGPSFFTVILQLLFYPIFAIYTKLIGIYERLKKGWRCATEILRMLLPPLLYDGIRFPRKYVAFFVPPFFISVFNGLTPPCVKGFFTHTRWWAKNLIPPLVQDVLSVVWANKFDIVPVFFWKLFLGNSRCQYRDTIRAIKKEGLSQGDVIFCHMITAYNYLAWAMVAEFCKRKGIVVKILFRYPISFIPSKRFDIRVANRLFEACSSKGVAEYFTDSFVLTDDYKNFINVPVRTLPIPHIPIHTNELDLDECNTINVAVLGNARAEKGFCEIVECLERMTLAGNKKFIFHLQINDPDDVAKASILNLESFAGPNLHVYRTALTDTEYSHLLKDADVILLPYHADVYRARTSGVLVEAIASGKLVIVSKNSWLSQEVETHGTGVIIRDRSSIDIECALENIFKNYNKLRKEAMVNATRYQKLHGGERFIECLVGGRRNYPKSMLSNVVIVFPFPDFFQQSSGATVRTGLLCRYLLLNGFNVKVVLPKQRIDSPHSNLNGVVFFEYKEKKSISSYFRSLKTKFALFGNCYRQTWYLNRFFENCNNVEFDRALSRAIDDCSFIIAEYPFDYSNIINKTSIYGNATCVTFHDLMGLFERQSEKNKCIGNLEFSAAEKFDYVVTVADYEHQYFNAFGLENILIPNPCVLSYASNVFKKAWPKDITALTNYVLFVGSNHLPNVRAAESLRVTAELLALNDDKITVVVCGSCMAPMKSNNFISFGVVDQSLLEILIQDALMIVCPLESGTGMSLKTIQAFSSRKLVLGTHDAFRGLPVENLHDCFIDDDIHSYHNKITEIANDIWKYEHVKYNAYELSKKFDFREQYKTYKKIIDKSFQQYQNLGS